MMLTLIRVTTTMPAANISLPAKYWIFVDELMKKRHYPTKSAVFKRALDLLADEEGLGELVKGEKPP